MKLGLHAFSLVLAGGLRDAYQPVVEGELTAAAFIERTAKLKLAGLQLARRSIADLDIVELQRLGQQAKAAGITLHLSTNLVEGEHLADMIRAAKWLEAPQVTVGLSHLKGTVAQRQHMLEGLLVALDPAIRTAERYKIMLAFENGRHTAAADLAAFVTAAQSPYVGVCFDVGNPLTVPEDPVASASLLGPMSKSAHLKNWQVYRATDGAVLFNCPLEDGVINLTDVLRVLNSIQPGLLLFLQTTAERLTVPVLDDAFLREYPRITARAMAGLLRQGTRMYQEEALRFPYEQQHTTEEAVLKWEAARLQDSLKHARKLLGEESLALPLGPMAVTPPAADPGEEDGPLVLARPRGRRGRA